MTGESLDLFKKYNVLGSPVSTCTPAEILDFAEKAMEQDEQSYHLMALNPIKVIRAQREAELRDYIERADVVYPDGIGICLALKWIHGIRQERIPGFDLHFDVLELCARHGWPVYLLGASPEINEQAAAKYQARYPSLQIAGRHHGYFNDDEFFNAILPDIQAGKPRLLVVAMGALIQEKWIETARENGVVPLSMGVGGSFDAFVGEAPRAPEWMLNLGLEWLYRLALQPKRYKAMSPLPSFFLQTLRAGFSGGTRH